MEDYWLKQTVNEPLFPDLIWSKPENKAHAGKLLIIGGSSNGFAHTVNCFVEANKAGAGVVKVLIPDAVKKLVGSSSEDIIYGPSTKSGGFAQGSLAEFLESSEWSDTILFSGELGNNSDTTILFEKFLDKYSGPLIVSADAFEFFHTYLNKLLRNKDVVFILDQSKLQKLSMSAGLSKAITSKTTLVNLVELLHELTENNQASLVIQYEEFIVVASQGYVSTTKLAVKENILIKLASGSSVWFMQNRNKLFEALSCAAALSQSE